MVGFVSGVIVAALVALVLLVVYHRRQRSKVDALVMRNSAQFRKITALERVVADERMVTAEAMRAEKLRLEREFEQYKILLRRADRALAEARRARDQAAA